MNRDMLSRRLQRRGFDVLIAVDGQAGIDTAESQLPDLILMDMSLPLIDGWDATRRLKRNPVTQQLTAGRTITGCSCTLSPVGK